MANAPDPAAQKDGSLNFDELFAGERKSSGAAAGGENLEELEAFLDEFEKNLDADSRPMAEHAEPAAAGPEPPPEELPTTALAPDFAEPAQAEELVQGLLKEEDLNLDVEPVVMTAPAPFTAAAAASPETVEELPEFEPEPPAPAAPAFIHAAPPPASRGVPADAAGFGRIGMILALVLGAAGLLFALGAGWMALNTAQALRALDSRGAAPVDAAGNAGLAKLQAEVAGLRKQVDALSKQLDGPVGKMAESYRSDMAQLQARVAALEQPPAGSKPAESPKAETPAAATPEAAAPPGKAPGPTAVPEPRTAAPVQLAGPWLVHLTSSDERNRAERELARARQAGLAAELTTAQMGGKTWYRVTVKGFANADQARAYVAQEAKQAGFGSAWIGKR